VTISNPLAGISAPTTTGIGQGGISGAAGIPAAFFGNGQAGFMSDPYQQAQSFTTDTGTTPAVPGDLVGRIQRIAGSLNATSADAVRPRYGRYPLVNGVGSIRNLFSLNTDAFTTRTFTTLAVQYTLSFTGTGTITLSGTSTAGPLVGTGASNRVSLTFTPSAGTLTLTVTGSVTLAQIERGSLSNYQRVGAGIWDVTEDGQPSAFLPYWSGSQWATFGAQSFGSASLFATATQSWTTWVVCRVFTAVLAITKAGAVVGNATFRSGPQANGTWQYYLRGTLTNTTDNAITGAFNLIVTRWNGTTAQHFFNGGSPLTLNVGTAAEESQNILISARTESSPAAFWIGHNLVGMVPYALTDQEIAQLYQFCKSTYGVI
jgi:hypothetical protein